jgi:hypothetical protein
MKISLEILRPAAYFGTLQLLGNYFLQGNIFLQSNLNLGTYFTLLCAFVFFSCLILLFFTENKFNGETLVIARILIFPLSSFVSAACLFLLFRKNETEFLSYSVAFLLLSLPASVWSLLNALFDEADERITEIVNASVASPKKEVENETEAMFHLENENGKVLLEVPIKRIICYEANDNYVLTHYLDETDSPKKSMERISLRKIEQLLAQEKIEFLRIHKSYLVNPEFVLEIKGRSQAYKLQLKHYEHLVPVSRSYDVSLIGSKLT